MEWEGQQLLRGSEVHPPLPFSPLLGNKQGEGESGYKATVTAVRMTASCDFRFLYSLERKQNILPEKKPVWRQEKKWQLLLHQGLLVTVSTLAAPPLAASSICCFDISVCQASRCLCDHRCNRFQNVTGVSLEVPRLM